MLLMELIASHQELIASHQELIASPAELGGGMRVHRGLPREVASLSSLKGRIVPSLKSCLCYRLVLSAGGGGAQVPCLLGSTLL
jgi:hypothetical protein